MKNRQLRFYCFSPPVMVATFIIEFSLLLYVMIRYKLNKYTRLIAALLLFLALFQLAEYKICTDLNADTDLWTRLGFVSITMLPALGMHLCLTIANRGWWALRILAYATTAGFIGLFAFGQQTFIGQVCGGNYVIFQLESAVSSLYYLYYYGWLLITIILAFYFYTQTGNKNIRRALKLLIIGYLVFLVPTTIINTYSPITKAGVPSIMCGFALIFALILAFRITPILSKDKLKNKNRPIDR